MDLILYQELFALVRTMFKAIVYVCLVAAVVLVAVKANGKTYQIVLLSSTPCGTERSTPFRMWSMACQTRAPVGRGYRSLNN